VTVGGVAGGAAATIELICARRNHPEQVAKIEAAAEEFHQRSKGLLVKVKSKAYVAIAAGKAQVAVIKEGVLDHAYKRIPKDKVLVFEQ